MLSAFRGNHGNRRNKHLSSSLIGNLMVRNLFIPLEMIKEESRALIYFNTELGRDNTLFGKLSRSAFQFEQMSGLKSGNRKKKPTLINQVGKPVTQMHPHSSSLALVTTMS